MMSNNNNKNIMNNDERKITNTNYNTNQKLIIRTPLAQAPLNARKSNIYQDDEKITNPIKMPRL